jgi:hypothetical protein
MFIDTDTAADVRNIVADSLRRKVNSLNSDIATYRRGQTSIVPKSQLRRKAIELAGQIEVYFAVFHSGDADGFDAALVASAQEAALYAKTTV